MVDDAATRGITEKIIELAQRGVRDVSAGTHADVGGIRLGVAAGLTQTAVAKRFNRCPIVNRPRLVA